MIQEAQDLLATTLAASTTFRTFVGAADPSGALERIYHDYIPEPAGEVYTPDELSDIRPCAMIYTLPANGFEWTKDAASGGHNCWTGSGRLVCVLMRDFPTDMDASEADVDFREIAGDILADIRDLAETGGYLAATKFSGSGPFRTLPEELSEIGDRQAFELYIDWGNR